MSLRCFARRSNENKMAKGASRKIWVLAVSAAFFSAGVVALTWDRGMGRTALLAVSFAGLIVIALLQTLPRKKKE